MTRPAMLEESPKLQLVSGSGYYCNCFIKGGGNGILGTAMDSIVPGRVRSKWIGEYMN